MKNHNYLCKVLKFFFKLFYVYAVQIMNKKIQHHKKCTLSIAFFKNETNIGEIAQC